MWGCVVRLHCQDHEKHHFENIFLLNIVEIKKQIMDMAYKIIKIHKHFIKYLI